MHSYEQYETAKLQQAMMAQRLEMARRNQEFAAPILKERAAVRWFRTMFHVRRWVHRVAPRAML